MTPNKSGKIFSKFTIGAIITGKVNCEKDQRIHIGVGQKGGNGGGSGGTFICRQHPNGSFEPLVIAGGAGGDRWAKKNEWSNASIHQYGNGSKPGEKNMNIGECGTSPYYDCYCGGAGYNRNPPDRPQGSPKCFQGGLQGVG